MEDVTNDKMVNRADDKWTGCKFSQYKLRIPTVTHTAYPSPNVPTSNYALRHVGIRRMSASRQKDKHVIQHGNLKVDRSLTRNLLKGRSKS